MTTKWDDDRIEARIEARTDDGRPGQKQLTDGQGYVVRLWDTGPADGRLDQRALLFDSETTYGGGGIFGAESEAAEYRDRRLTAQLVGARAKEALTAERRDQLPRLGTECIQAAATAKREAREANARAKVATDRHDALTEEALAPVVIIECPPRGSGWSVCAALCETEGHDGEPRTLAQVVPDEAVKAPPKRKRGKKKASKAIPPSIDASIDATLDAAPTSAPDCANAQISEGSKVHHIADEFDAEVTRLLRQDKSGGWIVEIEDARGMSYEVLSTELERIDDSEGDGDGWE